MLVVQPGLAGFNAYALVCLLGALLQAVRDLLTRRIAPDVPAVLITLSTTVVVTALAGALSLVEGWRAFAARDLALLALLVASGLFVLYRQRRRAQLSPASAA